MMIGFPLPMQLMQETGVFLPASLDSGEAEELAQWLYENVEREALQHFWVYFLELMEEPR